MKKRTIAAALSAILMLVLAAGLGSAQSPLGTAFTYQGRLTDNGSPASGEYDLRFRLYDEATLGTLIGTDNQENVPVSEGLFTVQLDFGSGAFAGEARWLEIGVRPGDSGDPYTTLDPRQELTAAPYADHALSAPWSGLSGVPAGLDDGDDDTTYAAGSGLKLSGTEFSVDTGLVQARVDGACAAGYAVRAVNEDGSVVCEPDDDTTYAAGKGLLLAGSEFAIDTTQTQARISGVCGAGYAVRAVNEDGTVACELDDDTTYAAGDGLLLSGNTFEVDTGKVQSRIDGACSAGYAVRAVNEDGSVVCELDDDTTYAAGDGLLLSGDTFSVEFVGSGTANTAARSDHDHWGQSWSGTGVGLTLAGGTRGLMASGSEYGVYAEGETADIFLANGIIHGVHMWLISEHTIELDSGGALALNSEDYVYVAAADDVRVRVDTDNTNPASEFGVYHGLGGSPMFSVSQHEGVVMSVPLTCIGCVDTSDVEDENLTGDDIQDGSLTSDDIQDGSLSADDVDPAGGIYSDKSAVYVNTESVALPAGTCIDISAACNDTNDLPLQGSCLPPAGGDLFVRRWRTEYWDNPSYSARYTCQICSNEGSTFTVEAAIACVSKP